MHCAQGRLPPHDCAICVCLHTHPRTHTHAAGEIDAELGHLSEMLVSLATAVLDFSRDAGALVSALLAHCVDIAARERDGMEEEELR